MSLDTQRLPPRIEQLSGGALINSQPIVLLPLDDRPCNYQFPGQLAAMVGQDIVMPPRELLGWFTRPGDCNAIAEWLRSISPRRLGIALDMLCFGGLVASRTSATKPETALARLGALRDLRQRRPDAVIFAFSTIIRLGKTVASAADLQEHLLLRSYCQLLDRVERLGESEARPELQNVQRQLDPERVADYMAVRRRNHSVNRAAVQLVAEGVLDYLILAQEDAAPVGIHLPEQIALHDQVDEYRVADRVTITSGADEMTMALLARHVTHEAGLTPAIAVDFATDGGADIVPAFEGQPLRDTVHSHIEIVGGRPVSLADSDAILFVHTPIGVQPDIVEAPPSGEAPSLAMQADNITDCIEAVSAAGRLFGLADVAYCNGADPELIAALERRSAISRLPAFAGWNTAANTLGNVISQLAILAARPKAVNDGTVRRFLAARLIDDYGYQTCVRRQAVARSEQLQADSFCLGKARDELDNFVNTELQPFAHSYTSQVLTESGDEVLTRITLPWGRLFEIEVEIG